MKKESKAKASKPKALPKPKNGVQYSQSELYELLRESSGFQKRKTVQEVMDRFVTLIQSAVKKGYRMNLPGLGKLQVRMSKARTARNPATGEMVNVPAKKRIRFTASKVFKEAVL